MMALKGEYGIAPGTVRAWEVGDGVPLVKHGSWKRSLGWLLGILIDQSGSEDIPKLGWWLVGRNVLSAWLKMHACGPG